MTMLDDETLSSLLHDLGDSFAVPASGVADTLRRVRRGDDERDEDGPPDEGRVGDGFRARRRARDPVDRAG